MLILYDSDEMTVGKYKGEKVRDVMRKDPDYIREFDDNKIAFCDDIMLELGSITSDNNAFQHYRSRYFLMF